MGQFYTNLKLVTSPAGSIAPSTFVTLDGTQGEYLCRQATSASDRPLAISQIGNDVAPGLQSLFPNASGISQVAAQPGEPVQLFTDEDVCPLTAGAGGWQTGDLIGVESGTGNGIVVASGSGTLFGAIALSNANQGEVADVYKKSGTA